jgi:hypothetical protein
VCQGGVCIFRGMDNVCLLDMEFVDYEVTMPWPQIGGSRITTATGLQIEFPEPGVQALVTVDGQARDGSLRDP